MASRTATDSVTIHDIRQIFRRYDANDSFQTVLDNEDVFNRICNTILRPIYRYASQSKAPQHSKGPPRKRRIQEIAVEEGISPELPSTPETSLSSEQSATQELLSNPDDQTLGTSSSEQNVTQESERTTASETSLSPAQSVTQERTETPEHNQTLQTSLSPSQSVTQEYNKTQEHNKTQEQSVTQEHNKTPEHNQTLQTCLSPAQNVTQERTETPEHNQTLQTSLSPSQSVTQERTETPEHNQTLQTSLSPSQSVTQEYNKTQEHNETQEQSVTQEHNKTPEHNQTLQTCLSPVQSVTQERTETPELTSISLPADASTPKSFLPNSKPTLDIARDSATEFSNAPPPPYSPQAESYATTEHPDSGIELSDNTANEDLASPNNPRIEISTTTKQDQTNQEHQAITAISESPYADRLSTLEMSLEFDSWIQEPKKKFWGRINTPGLKEEGDANTRLKFFVQNALTKRSEANIQKLQYRFTSILVYQSFQKMMNTERITSGLVQKYLELINIPLESQSACMLLLHGGKNRIEFDQRIAPDRDEIDHGPQCVPDLDDNIWDYIQDKHSRVRTKVENTVAELKEEDIASWSERSRAQAAAKEILLYGQKLLDLEDFQTKRKGQKRKADIINQTSLSNVYTMDKRIRTGFQNSRPNTNQSMATPQPSSPYTNATILEPNFQNSSPNIRENATTSPPRFQNTCTNPCANTIHPPSAIYQEHAAINSAPNENPYDLSMRTRAFDRTHSSHSWISNLPSETIESNVRSLDDLAQAAYSVSSGSANNLSYTGTIQPGNAPYQEHTLSNDASDQNYCDPSAIINSPARTWFANLALETSHGVKNSTRDQDGGTTGDINSSTAWTAWYNTGCDPMLDNRQPEAGISPRFQGQPDSWLNFQDPGISPRFQEQPGSWLNIQGSEPTGELFIKPLY